MRTLKKFGALAAAVFALSAIGAANASAAEFTASATGNLVGKALENQVFTTNGGTIQCSTAASKGPLTSTAAKDWHLTIFLSGCSAFGFASVDIVELTFTFTSIRRVHLTASLIFTPTLFGTSLCTLTMAPQELGSVEYANSGTSNVKITPNISGIVYTSSGGSCGSSGSNGTFKGASEVSREGGGTVRFDP
jgi:hypothetical protein